MTPLVRRIVIVGLAATIGLCAWMWLFGVRTTENEVARTIQKHLPIGTDKATVMRYLQDRGYGPAERKPARNSDDLSQSDPTYIEYHAASVIYAVVPNVGPAGFWGWIQVAFAFDEEGRLVRFKTAQWYNGP